MNDIEYLISQGDLIEAMREYSKQTQTDLIVARDAIEHYKDFGRWPQNNH